MDNYSAQRLSSRITDAVNTIIVSGEIRNPHLAPFVSVTDIEVSKDNAYAKLYVSCLDESRLAGSVKALQSAAGFIQVKLGKILNTKNTPKLTFIADSTQFTAQKVDKILDSI